MLAKRAAASLTPRKCLSGEAGLTRLQGFEVTAGEIAQFVRFRRLFANQIEPEAGAGLNHRKGQHHANIEQRSTIPPDVLVCRQ